MKSSRARCSGTAAQGDALKLVPSLPWGSGSSVGQKHDCDAVVPVGAGRGQGLF